MTGRRERERKAARDRAYSWNGTGWTDIGPSPRAGASMFYGMPVEELLRAQGFDFTPRHNPLGDGYSPWTGEWFRDPPPGQPFACDVDGTIILHPSQWKVVT